mgnify:CR=1 FL=1
MAMNASRTMMMVCRGKKREFEDTDRGKIKKMAKSYDFESLGDVLVLMLDGWGKN